MKRATLRLRAAGPDAWRKILDDAQHADLFPLELLSLAHGLRAPLPRGLAHDIFRSELGRGIAAFAAARAAFRRWHEFDLGWVSVLNPDTPIETGALVGVEARTAGLWSVNVSRITETVDTPTAFGFLYTTTALHMEAGQERFVLEFDPTTEAVSYLLEAVSRPRHWLARLGYPFTRAMQHRFARDSHARMRRAVQAR